jgi:hypothetical protein
MHWRWRQADVSSAASIPIEDTTTTTMKMAATTVPPLALTLKAIIIFGVGGVDAHTKLILKRGRMQYKKQEGSDPRIEMFQLDGARMVSHSVLPRCSIYNIQSAASTSAYLSFLWSN